MLLEKLDYALRENEINKVKKDIKGLATIKIGHVALNSTDNISYLLTSTQPEFEEFEDEVYELGGNTIYFAESPSDHELPCMSQLTKIEDIQLIGNDFSDGFVFVEDEKRK